MGTLSIRLPAKLEARLSALARRRRQSKSVLVREAIERFIEASPERAKFTVFDLVSDLAGNSTGARDLSRNKKHMRGFGR